MRTNRKKSVREWRPPPATDPVVRGCLDRLRRGEATAAGVLADRMEELGLPYASHVRRAWDRYLRRVADLAAGPLPRRKARAKRNNTLDDEVEAERDALRGRIANLFRLR